MKNRIEQIIELKGLSPSKFSDLIGVQRSRISHIMSGRNKPSIEIVTHIIKTFPDINLLWLMTGNGNISMKESSESLLFDNFIDKESKNDDSKENTSPDTKDILSANINKNMGMQINSLSHSDKEIDRIIVFYRSGSFKEYKPE